MNRLFAVFSALLLASSVHAEALTRGAAGGNDEDACNNAKNSVKKMIEDKGAAVAKFSNCDCVPKNAMVTVCKVTGYFGAGEKPETESK